MTLRRVLFLDRDGVINVDHGYVHTPARTDWVPGIFELGARARRAGLDLVVVTNQAGIARGFYTEDAFLAYTAWVHEEFERRGVPLLATYHCPHHPTAGDGELTRECDCRKPRPGLILRAAREWGIDLRRSILIGDKPSDARAGHEAGVGVSVCCASNSLLEPLRLFDDLGEKAPSSGLPGHLLPLAGEGMGGSA